MRLVVHLLRGLVALWPGRGLQVANAARIRPWLGWLLNAEVTTHYFGVRLRVNTREWEGFYIAVGRCYERSVLGLFRRTASKWRVAFDVGANLGTHALVIASANPATRVWAFEPDPSIWLRLERNIRLNGMEARVWPVPVAMGASVGLRAFAPAEDARNLGTGHLVKGAATGRLVPCWTLSAAAAELGAWPDLVKVDVEGAEMEVLLGLEEGLKKGHPLPDLLVEFHGWMFGPDGARRGRELLAWLLGHGWNVWRLDEGMGAIVRLGEGANLLERDILLASAGVSFGGAT